MRKNGTNNKRRKTKIPRNPKSIRKRFGITQQEFADCANVSRSLINLSEMGLRSFRHSPQKQIENALITQGPIARHLLRCNYLNNREERDNLWLDREVNIVKHLLIVTKFELTVMVAEHAQHAITIAMMERFLSMETDKHCFLYLLVNSKYSDVQSMFLETDSVRQAALGIEIAAQEFRLAQLEGLSNQKL